MKKMKLDPKKDDEEKDEVEEESMGSSIGYS